MTKYLITIKHHSISRARQIEVNGTLAQAKTAATREFGQEQRDYTIAISDVPDNRAPEIVSTRRVSARKWHDYE